MANTPDFPPVYIFPDTVAAQTPASSWQHWMKNKLRHGMKKQYDAHVLPPPDKNHASWSELAASTEEAMSNEAMIAIGYGLGALSLLRVLERGDMSLAAAHLVATPLGIGEIDHREEFGQFAEGFQFDWTKVLPKSRNFKVYHGKDDPKVPIENGVELARQLQVSLIEIPGKHFEDPLVTTPPISESGPPSDSDLLLRAFFTRT
jgi:predicted alpha/beta hydrolase family esterase